MGANITHVADQPVAAGNGIPVAVQSQIGVLGAEKLEDNPAASGDMGTFVLGVRTPTTAVALTSAAGDYGGFAIDAQGRQITSPFADTVHQWQSTQAITVNTDTSVKASAGAGLRNYITDVTLSNSSAAAVLVQIKDGSTVIWQAHVPAGGTVTKEFSVPLKGTAATAVNVNVAVATTTMYVSLGGFIGV